MEREDHDNSKRFQLWSGKSLQSLRRHESVRPAKQVTNQSTPRPPSQAATQYVPVHYSRPPTDWSTHQVSYPRRRFECASGDYRDSVPARGFRTPPTRPACHAHILQEPFRQGRSKATFSPSQYNATFGGMARDCPRSSENLIAENAPHNTHLSIGPPVLFDLMYIPTLGNQTTYLTANEQYPCTKVSGSN